MAEPESESEPKPGPGRLGRAWGRFRRWLAVPSGLEAGPEPPARVDVAAILRKTRRLRFRVRRGVVADLAGAYAGARAGSGLTFADLRPYEPGDDVRHLDWNVTARQDRPYVRTFIEERALTVWLLVDVSASLRFGPDGATKADRAVQAAALLATAAIRVGDRVGLALVSDRVEAEIAPGAGPSHLARLIRALVATPSRSRRTALEVGLKGLARARRRALLVVFSDFLADPEPTAWRVATRRHDVVGVRVVEPREQAIPDVGLVDLVDAETGERRTVDFGSPAVRLAYAEAAAARERAFRRWCLAAGVVGVDLPTSGDPISPLIRFFADRARGRDPR